MRLLISQNKPIGHGMVKYLASMVAVLISQATHVMPNALSPPVNAINTSHIRNYKVYKKLKYIPTNQLLSSIHYHIKRSPIVWETVIHSHQTMCH